MSYLNQDNKSSTIENNAGIDIGGELKASDYITTIPLEEKTVKELKTECDKQLLTRENTRSKLVFLQAKIFGCTLGASFLLTMTTAFLPDIDKTLIKDLLTQTIAPQVTLLSFSLGFYFGSNKMKE
ncbi:hypothetical protein H6G54_28425 [Anabaena cylindrica FACHB-243]|uniref:Uncharacterized protein n=1 Tax=Anabaena cylindrica (strain ATCC 27899 / PCC 7122) TaxID=272123 RepID=K9ZSE0_ANACC|nr:MULTISPECIES: hypothetical protein [Anabaena]AFZ61452.1 hypothetical protein Anacy_6183 [Anabaena cylindrica PCC 7122]MBD2421534.1 hypothetical protein [Anabaena cylindrica FACHB-243]MBY5284233.1 hypothetical protein [Anabaena sp. CCAP 1446/1C]MBY5310604.1 hypothetical protein [Anabaena sp. CCAP 1446/1C]MCM2405950.1 hypothetical protein [Anabaena sp. CCAP 1446/1C]